MPAIAIPIMTTLEMEACEEEDVELAAEEDPDDDSEDGLEEVPEAIFEVEADLDVADVSVPAVAIGSAVVPVPERVLITVPASTVKTFVSSLQHVLPPSE